MTEERADLSVTRCESCHSRYLPRPGPCPRCGATEVATVRIPPVGRVLASTQVLYAPSGRDPPYGLALVAAAEEVRILAGVVGALPRPDEMVHIELRKGRYLVRSTPTPSAPTAGPS